TAETHAWNLASVLVKIALEEIDILIENSVKSIHTLENSCVLHLKELFEVGISRLFTCQGGHDLVFLLGFLDTPHVTLRLARTQELITACFEVSIHCYSHAHRGW